MALDRHSIEKKDFPLGERGYDPDAVDAHLVGLADEVTALKQESRRRSDTVASSASDRVRTIVDAAEQTAAEIQRAAEGDAREIRDEAANEANATRETAAREAREYLEKVSASTHAMIDRLRAMEEEMNAMIETVRTGSNRLQEPQFAEGFQPAEDEPAAVPEAAELESVAGEPGHVNGGEHAQAGQHGADAEGARLIALNMALNGTPREETARYLSENFQLTDAGGLLDEVYASVES